MSLEKSFSEDIQDLQRSDRRFDLAKAIMLEFVRQYDIKTKPLDSLVTWSYRARESVSAADALLEALEK